MRQLAFLFTWLLREPNHEPSLGFLRLMNSLGQFANGD